MLQFDCILATIRDEYVTNISDRWQLYKTWYNPKIPNKRFHTPILSRFHELYISIWLKLISDEE